MGLILWTEPATRDSNCEFYKRLINGDKAARDEMIAANIALVVYEVDRFLLILGNYNHLRDDLVSSGYVGLIEGVETLQTSDNVENPTGMLCICIRRQLGKTIEAEETIRIPGRTKRRHQLLPPEKTASIFTDDETYIYDESRLIDLRETLEACCENDIEREVLRLREAGYVDREVAEMLDLSHTTAYVTRRLLYARFLELTGWKGQA